MKEKKYIVKFSVEREIDAENKEQAERRARQEVDACCIRDYLYIESVKEIK